MAGPTGKTALYQLPYALPDDTVDVPRDEQAMMGAVEATITAQAANRGKLLAHYSRGNVGEVPDCGANQTVSWLGDVGFTPPTNRIRVRADGFAFDVRGGGGSCAMFVSWWGAIYSAVLICDAIIGAASGIARGLLVCEGELAVTPGVAVGLALMCSVPNTPVTARNAGRSMSVYSA